MCQQHNSGKELRYTTLFCLHITMADNLQIEDKKERKLLQSESVQKVCHQLGITLSDLSGYVEGFPGCYVRMELAKI